MSDQFGDIAKKKNSDLVNGKMVIMIKDVSETDRYNRLLRYVLVDNQFINHDLVKSGYATSVTYPPDVACNEMLSDDEAIARYSDTGGHVNLCSYCKQMSKENILE